MRTNSCLNETAKCTQLLKVRDILRYLEGTKVTLPNGGNLSTNRFLQLGLDFGMHGKCLIIALAIVSLIIGVLGGIDRVHRA